MQTEEDKKKEIKRIQRCAILHIACLLFGMVSLIAPIIVLWIFIKKNKKIESLSVELMKRLFNFYISAFLINLFFGIFYAVGVMFKIQEAIYLFFGLRVILEGLIVISVSLAVRSIIKFKIYNFIFKKQWISIAN